jgi:glycosyltransferase involved in cell wall biosynthesis
VSYVGSFGGWYMTEEMLDFFAAARDHDPRTAIMILTTRDKESVLQKVRARGFLEGDYFVDSVAPEELPAYLCATDVAVSFIKSCYSKQSSSPTKIAEYLFCGLPIVANRGVGDVDEVIGGMGLGTLIEDFSLESYQSAIEAINELGDVADQCRAFAAKELNLETVGGVRYRRMYARLLRENAKRS